MIDWHSHILPAMDDGSSDVRESLMMLEALGDQGVERVIATPHFYANEESVEDFLGRREKSYELLQKEMKEDLPLITCGAEVKYYPGIGRMQSLERLAINNTKLLLLEMTVERWTEYMIKELIELAGTRGLTIVIAHIERYMALQNRRVIERLCENGLLMQVNARLFARLGSRMKAMKLLDYGMVHFIGSDCHNMTSRPPDIGAAFDAIRRKFGEDFFTQMQEYGRSMFEKNE